jgi:hypothetical protein
MYVLCTLRVISWTRHTSLCSELSWLKKRHHGFKWRMPAVQQEPILCLGQPCSHYIAILMALCVQAMMALQALPAVQAAQAVQAAEATRAVELLTNHPTAQSRVTRLTMPLLVPANAAVQLGNLRELHVQGHVSVGQVQALQCLSCLTSLTARGLTSKLQDPVLQPSDLPPRLQAFRVQGLRLYALDKWMPALVTVS